MSGVAVSGVAVSGVPLASSADRWSPSCGPP